MLELVSPSGKLYRVQPYDLQPFCVAHGLLRPDNVLRLADLASSYRISQGWQALVKVRWLQKVDKEQRPVDGCPLQPILGEMSECVKTVLALKDCNSKELSRLFGKSKDKPKQYKGWAPIDVTLEQARRHFRTNAEQYTFQPGADQVLT